MYELQLCEMNQDGNWIAVSESNIIVPFLPSSGMILTYLGRQWLVDHIAVGVVPFQFSEGPHYPVDVFVKKAPPAPMIL